MTNTIIHEEMAPHSKIIKALLGLTLIFLVSALVFSGLRGTEDKNGFQIVAIVTVVIAYAYWSFFNMRFKITTEGVEASMSPFTYRIKYPEIEDVFIDKIPWWTGWGLRLWWRRIAFVSRHGVAVVVNKKSGVFKSLWLSTKDPENFAKKIRDGMKNRT